MENRFSQFNPGIIIPSPNISNLIWKPFRSFNFLYLSLPTELEIWTKFLPIYWMPVLITRAFKIPGGIGIERFLLCLICKWMRYTSMVIVSSRSSKYKAALSFPKIVHVFCVYQWEFLKTNQNLPLIKLNTKVGKVIIIPLRGTIFA